MHDLVRLEGGIAKVSSKVIADAFGKIHRNVLRDIERLDCSEEFRVLNFEQSTYISEQNKILPCVEMTRDGFCFLAMGFTGKEAAKWKEAFIVAFKLLEEAASKAGKSAMESLGEAIAMMESDKERASLHAKALSKWRKIRKQHIEAITIAHERAQLVLNFSGAK